MVRYVAVKTSDVPAGGNKVVSVGGREIVIFHANGEFFALLNRCPHEGAPLSHAVCVAHLHSSEPGEFKRSRVGELLRCPWHGWEYDMRTGQSYCDPSRLKVRAYPVTVSAATVWSKAPSSRRPFRSRSKTATC